MNKLSTTATFFCACTLVAACNPSTQIALRVTNACEQVSNGDTSMGFARISISETGDQWLPLAENIPTESLVSGATRELSLITLPQGRYEGIKVELEGEVSLTLEDGSSVSSATPTLAYQIGGMARCASEDNGFSTGNEHFLYSTRNGALTQAIEVGPEEGRALVFSMEAKHSNGCSNQGQMELVLNSWVRYTGFSE